MKTVLLHTLDKTILKEWKQLWEKSDFANYTNAPQWFESILKIFDYKEYLIIALYERNTLVGIAPLVKIKKYGVPLYTVAPSNFVYGMPFLIDVTSKKQLNVLLRTFETLGTVCFDNIPETVLHAFMKNKASLIHTKTALNYQMPFEREANGQAFIRNRKKLLHKVKGIEDDFSLKSYNGKQSEMLNLIFDIDSRSKKQGKGYGTFASEETRMFYQEIAKTYGKYFIMNILYYQEIPIAYEIGFEINKTYFGNQIAFVTDYAQFSPGKVLVVKTFDELIQHKIKTFDFGSGDSHLKRMLTDKKQNLYQVVLSKNKVQAEYLKGVSKARSRIYTALQNNPKVYSVYRSIYNKIIS